MRRVLIVANQTATSPALIAQLQMRSAAGPVRHAFHIVRGIALRALFLGNERLPIGDRDLVVIRMDLAKRQEAVPMISVIDECGLQRGLDAGNLC